MRMTHLSGLEVGGSPKTANAQKPGAAAGLCNQNAHSGIVSTLARESARCKGRARLSCLFFAQFYCVCAEGKQVFGITRKFHDEQKAGGRLAAAVFSLMRILFGLLRASFGASVDMAIQLGWFCAVLGTAKIISGRREANVNLTGQSNYRRAS